MPYTTTWANVIGTPLGSADPGTLDTTIQQKMVDLGQRLASLVVDVTADPVVLNTAGLGAQTGVVVMFSPEILAPSEDNDDVIWGQDYFEGETVANHPSRGHLALPIGATLKSFEAIVDINSAPSLEMAIYYRDHSITPATTLVVTATRSSAGVGTLTSGAISHAIATNRNYFVRFNNAAGGGRYRVYSMKAVIDVAGFTGYIG